MLVASNAADDRPQLMDVYHRTTVWEVSVAPARSDFSIRRRIATWLRIRWVDRERNPLPAAPWETAWVTSVGLRGIPSNWKLLKVTAAKYCTGGGAARGESERAAIRRL